MSPNNSNQDYVLRDKMKKYVGVLLGFLVGSFLIYLYKGQFPYVLMIGALTGASILFILDVMKSKRE